MAAVDSLKEAYYSLEDKWYGFVDAISDKVPAFGEFIDLLEDKGVPTFPAAIILVLIIIGIIIFLLTSTASSSLTITVLDSTQNPVEGASVIVLANNETKETKPTNSEGKVTFMLPNGDYSVRVSKDGMTSDPKAISLSQNTDETVTPGLGETTISKSVYLKTADGGLVPGSGTLVYKCKGTANENTANYSGGVFTAIVPQSCTEVEVLSIPTYNLIKNTASFSANDSTITVQKTEIQTGTVTVNISIENSAQAPPAGLRVSLVPSDNTSPIMLLTTGTTILTFTSVPVKSYYVLVSSDGNYQAYDGSKVGDMKSVLQGATTTFNAVLKKAASSTVKITLKDKQTNNPVAGAEVRLSSAANENDYATKITGATGQLTFSAVEGTNYIILVDHPDYVTGRVEGVTAGQEKIIFLDKADQSNSNSLLIRVLDPSKNPVENARVVLKKIDPAEPVIGEKITGATGEAQFYNLEPGTSYMATVSKEGYGSVNSTTTQVSAKEVKQLEVTFDIGYGLVRLKVMDPNKTPLSGVTVKAINQLTSQPDTTIGGGATQITTPEGIAEYSKIRVDKQIYFTIEASGYAKYFTAIVKPAANGTTEKEIVMQRTGAGLSILPIEIYSGTQEVSGTSGNKNAVAQGTYTVKALLTVPKGTFSEAGIHLRTGKQNDNATNLMEEDSIYIGEAQSSGRITKGTTYSPPNGYDKDSKNLTQGNAKWVNSIWRNPQEGVYELEAQVSVTEASPNAPISIRYRGWGKGSTVLRDPASTASTQNELYSSTKERVLSFGATNLCSGSFCKSYSLESITGSEAGKPKKYITGAIEAKLGVQYLLTADLTNYSGRTLSAASLAIEGKSLDVKAISVNGAEQTDKTINLGSIGPDMPIRVQVLFTATNSGTSGIKLTINSATQTELDELITVNVKPNKKFSFSVLPKIIVPYIINSMFFEARDNNSGLEGVLIEIKSKGNVLGNVQTTGEGLAKFELSAPRIGDALTFTAKKEGYDTETFTTTVDQALLTITPPAIEETIKIGDVTALTESIIMQNNTAKALKIKSAEISGDVKSYLEVKFLGTIAGTVINQGEDRNYELSMRVSMAAQHLSEPKDVTGKIMIVTEIPGTSESYLTELPIAIHLTMPGYLDSPKCLTLNPTTLDFITSDSEQSKTVTITNSCTAEGTKVTLHNLEAKLSEAAKFGTISISGQGFMNTSLSSKYVKIADDFESDGETDLTIRFNPNPAIASGTQTVRLTINGKNVLEDKTTEKTEANLTINTTMSNLSKCVTVTKPEGGIIIDVAPWNMGYGRLMASDMSAYANSYGGFANRGAYSPYGYGSMYLPGMGMQGYGMAGYGAGYGAYGATGTAATSTRGTTYAQSAFNVRNDCGSDVDVDLDVDSRISVSSQKFTISKGSAETVTVQPGYILGIYKIGINAKPTGITEAKKKVDTVNVTVRRLGEMDTDCIKTNVTKISLNSMVMRPQRYSVYNYCYDIGVQLSRNNLATVTCSAPRAVTGNIQEDYFQMGMEPQYATGYPLGNGYNSYYDYLGSAARASMQMNGCPTNACSLIAGTSVWFRSLQQGGPRGTIEKIDFQVYPSPQYVPQRKLFDSKTNRYGPFQTIGDFRQWMTESDARMNVYGQLHISYSNQYGVAQCEDYPITLEDVWRVSEILDSAVNWGDPEATPQECQNRNALNITEYWKSKNPDTKGAIPENQYSLGDGSYVYIAEAPLGPALRIGPSSSQPDLSALFDSSSYYALLMKQKNNNLQISNTTPTATKNCGLLDSIEVLTQISADKANGAIITVEPTPILGSDTTGSLLKNTRGRNLMVTVDRSQMTAPCVHLKTPITARVSRQATFESQQLVWPLDIIITKPGVTYEDDSKCKIITDLDTTSCEDLLKQKFSAIPEKATGAELQKALDKAVKEVIDKDKNPSCKPFITGDRATQLYTEWKTQTAAAKAGACTEGTPKDYGFDKITRTKLASLANTDLVDCTTSFCNGEMLQGYLLTKFNTIKEKIKIANLKTLDAPNNKLSKLYKQALVGGFFSDCGTGPGLKFYAKGDGTLLSDSYSIPSTLLVEADKTAISDQKNTALPAMRGVLDKVLKAEPTDVLLEVDSDTSTGSTVNTELKEQLSMKDAGGKYYMTLAAFKKLNDTLSAEEGKPGSDCLVDNKSCTIKDWCGTIDGKITPTTFRWIKENSRLVKGIADKADLPKETIEKIYAANPALAEIHKLALFDTTLSEDKGTASKDLLLTTISDLNERPKEELFPSDQGGAVLKDLELDFGDKKSTPVGQYKVELDYENYADLDAANNYVSVTLTARDKVEGAPKAGKNILLETGFNVTEIGQSAADSIGGTIIMQNKDGTANFYKRIPVKLTATIYGGESTGLKYSLASTSLGSPDSLITWYTLNGAEKGADKKEGTTYKAPLGASAETQVIQGIYYYPDGGTLRVQRGQTTGGQVIAKQAALGTAQTTLDIKSGTQTDTPLEIKEVNDKAKNLTLDQIVIEVNGEKTACPADDKVLWNEKKLIAN